MAFRRRFTAAVALGGLAVLSVTLAGCGGGGGGTPAATSPAITSQTSRAITFAEFQNTIAPSPPAPSVVNRVEIELKPQDLSAGPFVADEVEIQRPQDVNEEEEIKSRILAIDAAAGTGTITLELGSLKVNFSEPGTEFKDNLGMNLTFAEFVEAVSGALPTPVPVKVERPPLDVGGAIVAQDPGDATFTATEIKLVDAVAEPEIEINVDADNLKTDMPQCDPALPKGIKVLGICIDVSQAEEQAQLEQEVEVEVPVIPGAGVEFEDRVVTVNVVDATTGTFTLASGTLVQVTSGTVIDPLGDLLTLQQVADAVAADKTVRAEGNATVVAVGPPVVLDATDVKVEVDQ